jgi:hypothetical protein
VQHGSAHDAREHGEPDQPQQPRATTPYEQREQGSGDEARDRERQEPGREAGAAWVVGVGGHHVDHGNLPTARDLAGRLGQQRGEGGTRRGRRVQAGAGWPEDERGVRLAIPQRLVGRRLVGDDGDVEGAGAGHLQLPLERGGGRRRSGDRDGKVTGLEIGGRRREQRDE